MAYIKSFFQPNSLDVLSTADDPELSQRLGLYQLFLRLYDQNRGLLDEILSLENSSNKSLVSLPLPYMQGVVGENQVHLNTNLLKGKTQALSQPQNIWTVGRDPRRVVLSIPDTRLSRCHAAIRYVDNQGFQLMDLGSSNGSFINGELVKRSAPLNDGDRIRLGSLTFTFFVCCQPVQTLKPLSPEAMAQVSEVELLAQARMSAYPDAEDFIPSPDASSNNCVISTPESTMLFLRDNGQ